MKLQVKLYTPEGSSANHPPYLPKEVEDIEGKTGEEITKHYMPSFRAMIKANGHEEDIVGIQLGRYNYYTLWLN